MYHIFIYIYIYIREKLDNIESVERNHSMIIKATTNLHCQMKLAANEAWYSFQRSKSHQSWYHRGRDPHFAGWPGKCYDFRMPSLRWQQETWKQKNVPMCLYSTKDRVVLDDKLCIICYSHLQSLFLQYLQDMSQVGGRWVKNDRT